MQIVNQAANTSLHVEMGYMDGMDTRIENRNGNPQQKIVAKLIDLRIVKDFKEIRLLSDLKTNSPVIHIHKLV